MQSLSTRSARHTLELAPTHVRQERATPKKKSRITIANSYVTSSATGFFATIRNRDNQRSIVKVSYSKNTKTRSWAAHGEYLQREHAQSKDEKGLGFNVERNSVDLKFLLHQWQKEEDEHVFRFIVSPENGHQMDLKQHAKELMAQVQKDLQKTVEWAAIDHHNTDHPHLHILMRGKDQRGHTLFIDSNYLSQGIRHRSQEIATRVLGLRRSQDLILARKKQVEREYVTDIDKSLRHKAVDSIVSFYQPVLDNLISRELRLLEVERLKFLESYGLAKKIGKKAWKLNDNLELTLRELQLSNDIIKSRARHGIHTFTHELPIPTQIEVYKPLTGKVVGMGLDNEIQDRRYLLLEGIDGKVHYIKATHNIVKARDSFELSNGDVVTLEKRKLVDKDHKPHEYIEVHNYRTLERMQDLPSSRLGKDVIEFVQTHGIEPKSRFPEQCFAHEYAHAMTKRFHELVQTNIIQQKQDRYQPIPDWQMKLSRLVSDRERALHSQLSLGLGDNTRGPAQPHHIKRSR